LRLISVNVGAASTVDINGQPVRTAYLKQPVAGRARVTRAGLEGNEVAVHTDAVYAFAHEQYARWAQELGADAAQWMPGHFAENLTIAGLDEHALSVGDRLRVGAEVELVVAGPRIPCFKLAWRMRQAESFVARFAAAGRTGVYFGVARTGSLGAGDAIEVIERSGRESVAEIAALIAGTTEGRPEQIEELLNLPYLSQTVALGLRSRLYRLLDGERTLEHRWAGWRRLRVVRVEDETADVRSYHLEPADGGRLPGFRAGQFLTVRCAHDAEDLLRTWSLSDYASEPATYRISVKREPAGTASVWLHEHVDVGSELDVRAPAGRFVLDRGAFKPVVLVAGGIGLTPLLAMAKSHLDRGPSAPPLHLVCCARNAARLPFRQELDALAARPGVRVWRLFSEPGPLDVEGHRRYDRAGRLTLETLETLLSDTHLVHGGRRIDLPWYDCEVYLCGPPSFQDTLLAQMSARGIDTARIRRESFVRPRPATSGAGTEAATIRLARSNIELEWRAGEHGSLLELLEQSGIERPSACRMGLCHSCRCGLLEGRVEHTVPPEMLAEGAALLCCSRPRSPRVVLDA
jgi:ferredoxin-NADP reductase/MOSC domain-containing protein YiiM